MTNLLINQSSESQQKVMKKSFISIMALVFLCACQPANETEEKTDVTTQPLSFQTQLIADSLSHLWAHFVADIDGDNMTDVVYINNNSSGGHLAYLKGQAEKGLWQKKVIAETPPPGGLFAAGDLEGGDIDADGDVDVLAVKHPGEWVDAGASAEIYWYKNPEWQPFTIGTVPDAVKDMSLADFDLDGDLDLAVLTFDEATLSIFRQDAADQWVRVQFIHHISLHEGMGAGDIDGNGTIDIIANGHTFFNPGGDLSEKWEMETIDTKWNTQEGDWSRNGTKEEVADLDGDGSLEVLISHSERAGYPIAWYDRNADGSYIEHIVADNVPACHTLKVVDIDLDGDLDIYAGINSARAVNLDIQEHFIKLYLNNGDATEWEEVKLLDDGIYNGLVSDLEGDGDIDLFRLPHHEAHELYIFINQLK